MYIGYLAENFDDFTEEEQLFYKNNDDSDCIFGYICGANEVSYDMYSTLYSGDEALSHVTMIDLYNYSPEPISIPDTAKNVLAAAFIIGAIIFEPKTLFGFGSAVGMATIANIIKYFDHSFAGQKIADFMLKLNKIVMFSSLSVTTSRYMPFNDSTDTIMSSMIASFFNSCYNLLEEKVQYSFITPEDRPTSGIDKHSCVDYSDDSWRLNNLGMKLINKSVGRTAKIITKQLLNEKFAHYGDLIGGDIMLDIAFSTISTIGAIIAESWIENSMHYDMGHFEKDITGAISKSIAKVVLEQSIEDIPIEQDIISYIAAILGVTASAISRTIYDGYWSNVAKNETIDDDAVNDS